MIQHCWPLCLLSKETNLRPVMKRKCKPAANGLMTCPLGNRFPWHPINTISRKPLKLFQIWNKLWAISLEAETFIEKLHVTQERESSIRAQTHGIGQVQFWQEVRPSCLWHHQTPSFPFQKPLCALGKAFPSSAGHGSPVTCRNRGHLLHALCLSGSSD